MELYIDIMAAREREMAFKWLLTLIVKSDINQSHNPSTIPCYLTSILD